MQTRGWHKLLVLLLSVVVLVGCGIPSYFYLGSSYYNFSTTQTNYNKVKNPSATQTETVDFIETKVSISLNDIDITPDAEDCPSAVIFYWIDAEETMSSTVLSNFQSKFSSKYMKNVPSGGVPLYIYSKDSAQDEPVVEEYTPSSGNSTTDSETEYNNKQHYRFYYPTTFLFPEGTAVAIEAPTYFAPPQDNINSLIEFTIRQGVNEAYPMYYKKFIIEYTDKDTKQTVTKELRRYNNEDFMSASSLPTAGGFDEFKNANNDYWAIASDVGITESTVLYVHFVVAFTATKGKFNNIFWSNLYSDSALTFPLTLDTFIQKPTPPENSGGNTGSVSNPSNSQNNNPSQND